MINVTKPYLPPLEEYIEYLREIWNTDTVTNNGPFVRKLEEQLRDYLGVEYLFLVNNATTALQIAIKALNVTGDIITTPFSWVATTSSFVWMGYEPVFVDIDKDTLTLDPLALEKSITEKTTAILPTHVYGNPCDVEAFEEIAKRYNLKVIYDAAHAFGVQYNGESLLNYGDVSILSFHATKLFHCIEGGALITNNPAVAQRIEYMRNFGYKGDFGYSGDEGIIGVGINGKMSELHAATGLCLLLRIDDLIATRKQISELYDRLFLNGISDGNLHRPLIRPGTTYNYGYYPVLFPDEKLLLKVISTLREAGILPRRYYYPSLNELNYTGKQKMPVSESVARRILCLPLYPQLPYEQVVKIASLINNELLNLQAAEIEKVQLGINPDLASIEI